MRKDALVITLTTAVLSVFAAFFRWLQNLNAFEPETGLLISGSWTTPVLTVYLIIAAAIVLLIVFVWLRRYSRETAPEKALAPMSKAPMILSWIACVVVVASAVVIMFSAATAEFPLMQRIFAALAIFGGFALPFIPAKTGGRDSSAGPVSIVFVVFCCFWLVFSYKNNSENPVIWAYTIETLAISATLLGAYNISAYYYGKAAPNAALVFTMLASILDIAALADSRPTGFQAIFASCAVMMFMYTFIIIENMRESFSE